MTKMDQLPVLYSFRRCPYAMRARMALYLSGVSVELREVVLRDKPESMLTLSPKGTVPVLQLQDGSVLDESLDIMLWGRKQAESRAWPDRDEEAETTALQLVQRIDSEFKYHLDRYKYPNRYEGTVAEIHREEAAKILHDISGRLERATYLSEAATPGLADYAIMPFVRQFSGVEAAWFRQQPWSALILWLDQLLIAIPFTAVMNKYAPWQEGHAPVILHAAE